MSVPVAQRQSMGMNEISEQQCGPNPVPKASWRREEVSLEEATYGPKLLWKLQTKTCNRDASVHMPGATAEKNPDGGGDGGGPLDNQVGKSRERERVRSGHLPSLKIRGSNATAAPMRKNPLSLFPLPPGGLRVPGDKG